MSKYFYGFVISLVAAIVFGAKVPGKDNVWPDSFLYFCISSLIAIVFLILWRRQDTADHVKIASKQSGSNDFIAGAYKKASQLVITNDKKKICAYVDDILTKNIRPYIAQKDKLYQLYGFDTAVEILIELAYAERMLNRVWSASADGCPQEAINVLPEAVESLNRVHNKLISI